MQNVDWISLSIQLTISAVTLTCEWLKGNKWPHVWKLAISSQVLWFSWIVYAGNWGLLPLTGFLTVIFFRNELRWRRERAPLLTVFGKRICPGCETQRNCVQHGCKNSVDTHRHTGVQQTRYGIDVGVSARGDVFMVPPSAGKQQRNQVKTR